MLSAIVLILIVVAAVVAIANPKAKSATHPPVPKALPLPEIELPMLEADMPPMLSEEGPVMLEADMPPAMLEGGNAVVSIRSPESANGFESRVTATGHQWFRPILDLNVVPAEMAPVHHAVAPSASQFVVARMLGLLGVAVGFGPQGPVLLKKTAFCSAPAQAKRMSKRGLKALQLMRSPA